MTLALHERTPSPALRSSVLRAVGFAERTAEPVSRREAPLLGVVVMAVRGPRIAVDGDRVGSFAAGLYDRPVVTGHDGEQAGTQLYLSLTGARRALGLPLDELANRTVALEDVLGPDARGLGDEEDALPRLEALLARRLAEAPPVAPEVRFALGRIAATHGQVRVDELARETGWSRRHLSARVRDAAGLPPKALARLARASRAAELLREPGAHLADVAYACGYSDQPHFTREFRAFAGVPPGEFPSVQDAGVAA